MRQGMPRRLMLFLPVAALAGGHLFAQSNDLRQRIAGTWYYRDSGGALQYTFNDDGTFSGVSEITASGFPRITIRKRGRYTVDGNRITVTPTEVDSNGAPGEKVTETGRYDPARDELTLRQANSDNVIVYRRASR
jgi:hypothetical protein